MAKKNPTAKVYGFVDKMALNIGRSKVKMK
jgi:hypothetical protein